MSHRTSARVRSGNVAANIDPACAPGPAPKITVEREPTASSTATASCTWVSRSGSSAACPDRPVALVSWRITRAKDANAFVIERISSRSHNTSRLPMNAWNQKRSNGPSPTVWYAIETPSDVRA
jgi:hypothetical protein